MGFFDEIENLFGGDQKETTENTANTASTEGDGVAESVAADTAGSEPAEAPHDSPDSEPAGQPEGSCQATAPEGEVQTNLFGGPVEDGCGCAAPKKRPKGAKKKENGNGNGQTNKAKQEKPKEPDHDLERLVVITAQNERRTYPPEMTLEEIRAEIEKDYPAFSKENTSWYFEKQENNNRYLCIPSYKFNKAG